MDKLNEASMLTLQKEIAELEQLLADKKRLLDETQAIFAKQTAASTATQEQINNNSTPEAKITLFRSLFRGREDVYARRFESKKTGKSGYQPVCRNEWVRGICEKPKINCGSCSHRSFEPVTNGVIRNHLAGSIVMGVYPLLQNETCHFLAMDFDKEAWREDVKAFMDTCKLEEISAALERSRSGNGAHVWIFFDNPVSAAKARKLGTFLMTRTLDRRPEIGLDSFDRFFPNQDTMPKGGFGNLIALPLQKEARAKNHSLFLDENLVPHSDQWVFLASIKRIDENKLNTLIQNAFQRNELLPVSYDSTETEDESKPWQRKSAVLPAITEPLPQKVEIVLADQLYVNHTGLPPILRNRILRLASFANPEFYQAQRMRFPTWNKPHILYCYEFSPKYIGLPVGCLDGLAAILEHYHIEPILSNEQNRGQHIDAQFLGKLKDEQEEAFQKLMEKQTGILSASTAFGKTVVALRVLAERKVNTIILVHRKLLADQWVERIHHFLGIPKKDIGYYSGTKKKRTGIIDIAVMQSIVKRDKVEDWISEYGQIIVDECHHISAASFERVVRKCPAYYRLGLSATIIRKDGQHPIVLMNLGEVRYSSVRNAAPLFEQKVFPRFTDFRIDDEKLAIQDIFHNLYLNEERNKLIVQDILEAYREGRECLVLSERVEHLYILRDALKEHAPSLFVLKGGLGKKQLETTMGEIQSNPSHERKIILATGKYLGEGFDLPSLDTLFLVFPFSWRGMLIQYTGRLNRVSHGKKEIRVYDYVDEKVTVLLGMYKKRLRGYKNLGFVLSELFCTSP
ncbi:MAG: DEAD/DEAH box helicase [Fibromonadaceae bacterium]|jgi:superfamily II DNA or RNA helicase|nr:DEAD/DEAH box helicase [Fibromonadaceae bacterium]